MAEPKPSKLKTRVRFPSSAPKPSDLRKAEYEATYNRLMERARGRRKERGIHENHHVIPRSLGGSDSSSNIVALTYKEHFLAHWLLTKFTSGSAQVKMLTALSSMMLINERNKTRIISGWQFEIARQALSLSARQKLLNYYAKPGIKELNIAQRNTKEALEKQRKSRYIYLSKPGASEAHKAACNTESAIENHRQASFRRFARPGEIEAFTITLREKRGKPVENTTLGLVFRSVQDATEYFEYKAGNIKKCCQGRSVTAGGYGWRYISKEEYAARRTTADPMLCGSTHLPKP
jgi:hypothetical protein